MLNGLLHLVAFIWKAHGDSPATFLLVPKRCQTAMRFPTSFVLFLYFTYPYQPSMGEGAVRVMSHRSTGEESVSCPSAPRDGYDQVP